MLTEIALPATPDHGFSSLPITTVRDPVLTEIGRVIAHHGLLLFEVREFVSFVALRFKQSPLSISTKGAMRSFPSVIETVAPVVSPKRRYLLQQTLDSVSTANKSVIQFIWSYWGSAGSEEGTQLVGRVQYRKRTGGGCWADRDVHSAQDLRQIAEKVSVATALVCRLQGTLRSEFAKRAPVSKNQVPSRTSSVHTKVGK